MELKDFALFVCCVLSAAVVVDGLGCDCESEFEKALKFISRSSDQLEDFAESFCLDNAECKNMVHEHLLKFKEASRRGNWHQYTICARTNLCLHGAAQTDKAAFLSQLQLAAIRVLNRVVHRVDEQQEDWTRGFCRNCKKEFFPMTDVFKKNKESLKYRIKRACSALQRWRIPKKDCLSYLNSWIPHLVQDEFPLCSKLCANLNKMPKINRDKLLKISSQHQHVEKEVNSPAYKSEKQLAVVEPFNRDSDSFCTMCIAVANHLPPNKEIIVKEVLHVVTETFFDGVDASQLQNATQLVEDSIRKTVEQWTEYYKSPSQCKALGFLACLPSRYKTVLDAYEKEKNQKCGNCLGFFEYLHSVLNSSDGKSKIANYLFMEITKNFNTGIFDMFGFDFYEFIMDALNAGTKILDKEKTDCNEKEQYCEVDNVSIRE